MLQRQAGQEQEIQSLPPTGTRLSLPPASLAVPIPVSFLVGNSGRRGGAWERLTCPPPALSPWGLSATDVGLVIRLPRRWPWSHPNFVLGPSSAWSNPPSTWASGFPPAKVDTWVRLEDGPSTSQTIWLCWIPAWRQHPAHGDGYLGRVPGTREREGGEVWLKGLSMLRGYQGDEGARH